MSKKPATKEETNIIPIGKRYVQMEQLVAEEVLPILEKTYEFIEMIKQACESDGELDPETFIQRGMEMLQSALKLEKAERMKLRDQEEMEEEEEGEEDEDEEEED